MQTGDMPVNQWAYYDMLRNACSPPQPPAEPWRVKLHDAVSNKVDAFVRFIDSLFGLI
jgi:hypothetical protein